MILSSVFIVFTIFGSSFGEFPSIPNSNVIEPRVDDPNYRLPENIKPISYDVTLEPYFDPIFEFDGSVTIKVEVKEATNSITLHSNELTIDYSSIIIREVNSLDTIQYNQPDEDDTYQFLVIPLVDTVQADAELEIYIEFRGILNTDNRGFYRAGYEEDGETKWFGTTQFESTSARQAFPCFDEPALKATFIINIIRTAEYSSISNMELDYTTDMGDGRFKDTFEESVVMSTYLVAFVVSELDKIEEGNQAVYATKYLISDGRGEYGLDVGIRTLAVMEEFTNVPYIISKLFQVAIPDDWFAAGAMENWGLVTYRERYLLYKEGLTTASEQQSVASIIAHELGHQWFGNLVSPLWWEYIWLNEGFATYFEYYATSVVEPEMRMMEQFVTSTLQYAFESDALETTRPMSYGASTPGEISALFDRVAYDKSGAVIRMMENFLGTDVYRRGLTIYLKNREYDAAEPKDLWEGLQDAVNEINPTLLGDMTVEDIMETWNSQAGYPVVNVSRNDGEIILSQERFLLNNPTPDSDSKWTIPINYAKTSNADFSDTKATYWLKEETENTGITVEDDEWIILNTNQTGYYRVNYDEDNWKLITDYLRNSDNFDNIPVLNRAQLLDDALNLARSGRLNYKIALNVTLYLSRETDYIPLYSFFRGLTFLHKHILNTEHYDKLKNIVGELLHTAYEELGATDSGEHTAKLNRINVLTWLCRYEDEGCIQDTHTHLAATEALSPDLQSAVYCGGLKEETNLDAKWDFLYERYSGDDAEALEKARIITALGCTHSVSHLNRFLNIAIDQVEGYTMSNTHKATAFSAVYTASDVGLQTAFDFITNTDNFNNMNDNLSTSQMSSIFSGISDRLTTLEQKNKLQSFIDSLPQDMQNTYASIFNTALNNIQTNIDWAEEYIDDISEWLIETNNGFIFAVSIPLLIITLFSHLFV